MGWDLINEVIYLSTVFAGRLIIPDSYKYFWRLKVGGMPFKSYLFLLFLFG